MFLKNWLFNCKQTNVQIFKDGQITIPLHQISRKNFMIVICQIWGVLVPQQQILGSGGGGWGHHVVPVAGCLSILST